jgi:cytochrome c peroxidase
MNKTICLLSLVLLFAACRKNSDLVIQELPTHAIDLLNTEKALIGAPLENSYYRTLPSYMGVLGMEVIQADDRKAGLGRVLFYDKKLSKDRSVSCASCHKQKLAFSDNVAFSTGIEGKLTARNSQPLANVASFSTHYSIINGKTPMLFWDERAGDVASQSRQTFGNPLEMGMEMQSVVDRIKTLDYYPYLWQQVYGNFEPTEAQVLECLQEFVGSIGSHDAIIDRSLEVAMDLFNIPTTTQSDTLITALYYGGNDTTINTVVVGLPGMSPSQNRGRDIFVANCTKCHSPIRPFQEVFAACNGLDLEYKDKGLAELSGNPSDIGVFKSPSLRNIALTAPYMHDGRFKTLQAVVDFYSDQVKPHPNLHPKMLHDGNPNLNLNQTQKQDLIAFLNTFTDQTITVDPRFSNPFK